MSGRAVATTREGGAVTPVAASEDRFSQTLTMVREAMLNPDVDANKAKVMAELMTSLEDRSMAAEFNRALNAAVQDMPVVTKAGIIVIPGKNGEPGRTQGRFARLEDIDRVVRPILALHQLAIRFEIGTATDGSVTVRPIISHNNGHTERGEAMRVPIDTSGSKNNTQGAGSAVTYGKRYAMCAALNIVTEGTDDDGSLGKLAIGMPHERQVTVLEAAEAAADEGYYPTWFPAQSPKDRGWLVDTGHHARLSGGVPMLGTTAANAAAAAPPAPPGEEAERRTARYEAACGKAPDRATLLRVQTNAKALLDELEAGHPALHARAVAAGSAASARLSGGEG